VKQLFLKCTLVLLTLTTYVAADYADCCYEEPYCSSLWDPCCKESPFDGFYIGGNIGVLTHIARRHDTDGFLTDNSGWVSSDTNIAGGGQIGYDWQCGSRVLGVVWDWNGANVNRRINDNPNDPSDNHFSTKLSWYTTIRGRAGMAVCNSLLYVTGGFAIAKHKTRWHDDPDDFHFSDTRLGWTGGVGAEFALSRCLTWGVEFLYLHFDDRKHSASTATDRFTFVHNDSAWNGRFMLNYRL
jgi:outer membrane immunogenic protein